jgi:hypothetical protein
MENQKIEKKTLKLQVKSLETKSAPLLARRCAVSPVIGSS